MLEEWKAIIKKPILWISMIGLALIPALYNIIFLSSMWDPYGQVDNLPVAIVNQDKSATYQGKTFTIGKDIVTNMKETKALDYHFVGTKEAKEGLEKGRYYLVVTLPNDLSEAATSVLSDEPKPLEITYQTSSGHSFVAGKMADSAMSSLKESVAHQVTESYTKALFTNLSQLSEGLDKASDAGHALKDGSKRLTDGSNQLSSQLERLAQASLTFTDGTAKLDMGLSRYVTGVSQAFEGSAQLASGTKDYTEGVDRLASGANQLNHSSEQLLAGVSELSQAPDKMQVLVNGSQQLTAGLQELAQRTSLSQEQLSQLTQLTQGLAQLNSSIQSIGSTSADLGALSESLTTIAINAEQLTQEIQATSNSQIASLQATSAYQALRPEEQAELTAALSGSTNGQAEVQAILAELAKLQSLQHGSNQSGLGQLQAASNQLLPAATNQLTTLTSGLTEINQAITTQLIPGSQSLSGGVSTAQDQLFDGIHALSDGVNRYTAGVAQLSTGAETLSANSQSLRQGTNALYDGLNTLNANSAPLLTGTNQLLTGALQLSDGSKQLANGGHTLSTGMSTLDSGVSALSSGLSTANDKLSVVTVGEKQAEALSKPVTLSKTELDKVDTNGVGMAPYMMSVALMVLALSTNMIFTKTVSGKEPDSRLDWISRKLAVNGVISVIAASILYAAVHWIGLTANYEWKTYLMTVLASATFMAMVTALYTWHERLGAFASIILLLLQLGSSAGTYPLPLTSPFFQAIHPFLPMSYTVSGLRQSISMTGHIGQEVSVLLFFLVGFIALGSGIFKRQSERG